MLQSTRMSQCLCWLLRDTTVNRDRPRLFIREFTGQCDKGRDQIIMQMKLTLQQCSGLLKEISPSEVRNIFPEESEI